MNTEEIYSRLLRLQDEINDLVAQLPPDARIAFGTIYLNHPPEVTGSKRLVVSVTQKSPTGEAAE